MQKSNGGATDGKTSNGKISNGYIHIGTQIEQIVSTVDNIISINYSVFFYFCYL